MVHGTGNLRILVVRHGETDWNVRGIIQGQIDTDLNSVGRRQAGFVAEALRRHAIDEVYSSPLRRARDTADIIVAAHPRYKAGRLSYRLDNRLKERCFGVREGKPYAVGRGATEGVEDMRDFTGRLSSFLADIVAQNPPVPFENDAASCEEVAEEDSEWEDVSVIGEVFPVPSILQSISEAQAEILETACCSRTVLLVAHGAAISALVGTVLLDSGLATVAEGLLRTNIWNCSITELIVDAAQIHFKEGATELERLISNEQFKPFRLERWADVRHIPKDINDAVSGRENVDEKVDKQV